MRQRIHAGVAKPVSVELCGYTDICRIVIKMYGVWHGLSTAHSQHVQMRDGQAGEAAALRTRKKLALSAKIILKDFCRFVNHIWRRQWRLSTVGAGDAFPVVWQVLGHSQKLKQGC